MNRRLSSRAHPGLRCAAVLASVLAASCAGDEFQGSGSGGASSTDAASSAVGSTGTPSTSPSASSGDTTTSGEGGSPVSTSAGEGASSGEGGGTGGTSGAGGGEGGGEPLGDCDPEVSGDAPIPDDCGVFVDPEVGQGGVGTKAQPFGSIAVALDSIAGDIPPRIYLRAGTVAESVIITGGQGYEIHGGLTTDWSFGGDDKTIITPVDDAQLATMLIEDAPLEVLLTGLEVQGRVVSAPGQSSVSIGLDNAELRLRRTILRAGNAGNGLAGLTPTTDIGSMSGPDDTLRGGLGNAGTEVAGGLGGDGGINERDGCDDIISRGGDGGDGADAVVADESNWEADGGSGGTGGPGGDGAAMLEGVSSPCEPGSFAADLPGYEPGDPGTSAAEGLGVLSSSQGIQRDTATTGTRGGNGRGAGGGGGGARRGTTDVGGDGGGGGAAGGCGGHPASAGGNGGHSIGIIAISSVVFFERGVTIQTGDAGRGGDGAPGQLGAYGGSVQTNTGRNGCDGGDGGRGDPGGDSGAGAGGHSFGVAYVDSLFAGPATMIIGNAGEAGVAPESVGNSVAGAADDFVEFPE
jgi:hypothetical protein